MSARTYSAAEVDAAIEALQAPGRFSHAQEVVVHAAPGLQQILNQALSEGGWFGQAHEEQLRRVAAIATSEERLRELGTLVAEQTRLGMLVGAAVGLELARELQAANEPGPGTGPQSPQPQES